MIPLTPQRAPQMEHANDRLVQAGCERPLADHDGPHRKLVGWLFRPPPRARASVFSPPHRCLQVVVDDVGRKWAVTLKRWTSRGLALHVLERTADCMRAHRAEPGDLLQLWIEENGSPLRVSVVSDGSGEKAARTGEAARLARVARDAKAAKAAAKAAVVARATYASHAARAAKRARAADDARPAPHRRKNPPRSPCWA